MRRTLRLALAAAAAVAALGPAPASHANTCGSDPEDVVLWACGLVLRTTCGAVPDKYQRVCEFG